VDSLTGEVGKAREKLGWTPKTSFKTMIAEMVASDLEKARAEVLCRENGYGAPSMCRGE
jgi:GDPmannose 4,6-dehydratase